MDELASVPVQLHAINNTTKAPQRGRFHTDPGRPAGDPSIHDHNSDPSIVIIIWKKEKIIFQFDASALTRAADFQVPAASFVVVYFFLVFLVHNFYYTPTYYICTLHPSSSITNVTL